MIVTVAPIYGYGWGNRVTGTVVTQDHQLFGYKFLATPRHENDAAYTCILTKPNPVAGGSVTLSGYCILKFRAFRKVSPL